MSGTNARRFLGVIVLCLTTTGCSGGGKYDGLTKEEGQPVIDLLNKEALGKANVDRLEGLKVKDVLIVRALYRTGEGKKAELVFRVENGKVTGRGFNKFGEDWRKQSEEVLKEFK